MFRWPPPDQIWCPALWTHRTWPHAGIGKSKSLPVPEGYHTLLVFSLLPNGGMLRNQFPDLFSVHISLGNFTEAHGLKTICWNHTLKCLLHISMLVSYSQNYYPPPPKSIFLFSPPSRLLLKCTPSVRGTIIHKVVRPSSVPFPNWDHSWRSVFPTPPPPIGQFCHLWL